MEYKQAQKLVIEHSKKVNYKVQQINCCTVCEYLKSGYDGDMYCHKFPNTPIHDDSNAQWEFFVHPLGICDSFEPYNPDLHNL